MFMMDDNPNQPKKFPKRSFGQKKLERRAFNPQWFDQRPWLHYEEVQRADSLGKHDYFYFVVNYKSDMGNKVASFTEEQLEAYQDCTFFTRKEILRIFRRFRDLSPSRVPDCMKFGKANGIKIPLMELEVMTELRENPFCERICQVFSEDGSGDMSFDDFLDMFSVFSDAAPRDIKCVFAFKVYDFDGDNFLSRIDLEQTLRCLTKNELAKDEISFIVDKVLEEADLDDDNLLSYIEFENVISRSPDFLNTFHIRI